MFLQALVQWVLASALLLAGSPALHAQTRPAGDAAAYPNRPVRLIVTYPPGGGNDIIARLIAQKFSESTGQPVIVENHAGAGGTIGTAMAAKSAPDGYTIVLVSTPFAMAPLLYPSLPYDTLKDLTPVTLVGTSPNLLVVHPSVPATTVAELVALAKAKPQELSAATLGSATTQHLAAAMLNQMARTDILLVPYKGSAPGMNDLLGGQVKLMFNAMPSTLPYVKAGRLRALAVTSAQRTPLAPELPTVAETLPGYEIVTWWGVLAPAGTPRAIIEKQHREIAKALQQPDVKAKLTEMGVAVTAGAPEAFATLITSELGKWAEVIRVTGAKAE
ncbi:MAG: tripartite tricarboxylate transporter substrate binding protein [Pseudomonadota bacterium]|nr:tripartite tricarboxylate transporter substrate binding protein [Pseudomonadota bacterium]